jgi:hypothetical protein
MAGHDMLGLVESGRAGVVYPIVAGPGPGIRHCTIIILAATAVAVPHSGDEPQCRGTPNTKYSGSKRHKIKPFPMLSDACDAVMIDRIARAGRLKPY